VTRREEADSAGPVKWVVPAWEVLAAGRGPSGGWGVEGRVEETESERKLGRRLLGAVRFTKDADTCVCVLLLPFVRR
jgi:hypothetical protein